MDPEGLFDFLEPTSSKAPGQTSSNLNGKAAAASSTRPSKRASSPTADRPSSPPPATKNKRPRVVPPPTVVTDEFTAEATRHVPVADGAAAADVAQSVKSQDENGSTDATRNGQADSSTGAGTIVTSTAKAALSLTHSVRHQVAIPPSYDYKPLSSHVPPADPARTWPFTLDPFQRTSISCIERNESVLVSAHTSAGKTVVAEYAIAQALRNGQRVVYTSPIKALSNQKYREMSAEFGDVGLMTGDVTINPSASCLVMTTEILRSMLYRGSEIMREVAWVIFDEIHYMRDAERGVVWEETIILLPRKVRYVFLSATIPNAMEFAEWIAHTHAQPCHVVYTDFRPTPLQHYLFPAGAEGIHLVVDERGVFREDNFQKAMGALGTAVGEDPASSTSGEGRKGKKGGQTRKGNKGQTGGVDSDIYKIVKMIMLKNYNPVIVFAFSKRECENLALSMAKLEFNTDEEKEMVSSVFTNAINALTEEDRTLPQIEHILPLLRRGIGIHHGGLLPILKEVIEILFQEGLIKVLFATETFSIGLNMPAKTVVFTAVRKFDGKAFRDLTSGEFIQMSGRAGRRGLDDRGIVIMMFDEKLEPAAAKNMVQGEADRLDSAFHLGYNMVLNLMRVEGVSPEYMLQRCFYQFQHAAKVPLLEAQMEEKIKLRDGMQVPREEEVSEVWTLRKQLRTLLDDKRLVISHPTYALSFLQPGRLIHVHYKSAELDLDFGWGVCAAFQKRLPAKGPRGAAELDDAPEHEHYIVDVLLRCAPGGLEALPKEKDSHGPGAKGIDWGRGQTLRPCTSIDGEGEMLVVPVLLSAVEAISGVRIKLPKDLTSKEERASVGSVLSEVEWRFTEADAEDKKRRKEEKDDKKFKKKSQKKDMRVKVRGEEERQRLQGEGTNVVVLGGDMPLLDPIKDQRVTDEAFKTLLGKIDILETRLKSLERELSGAKPTILAELYKAYGEKDKLSGEIEGIRSQITAAESVLQLDELKCRKRVLRRLGFTDSDDVVQKKGRVACEISTGDELLLTEMIFNGVFNELTPEQCAALLSCFVFTEKSNQQTRLPEELAAPLRTMQESARRIALVQRESRLPVVEDEYVSSFKVELMDAVMQWCRGAKFAEVCKLTDVFEGSLIRTFRRLQELIRQMTAAAKAIGNEELEQKFTASQAKLERESSIIFSPSLYL